jgi:GMP synthase (glutamine-hydrolysing)
MRGYVQAKQEALAHEGRCSRRLSREVSAAPHARRVLRRFVRHARALGRHY